MKYCTNCGKKLKEDAKFCTKCGTHIENKDRPSKATEPVHKVKANKSNYSSKTLKIFLSIIAIVVLGFIMKSFITDLDVSRNPYSISKTLTPLVGTWKAPTGSLLKDNKVMIKFRKRGDVLVGEDSAKRVYIQLLPYTSTNFSGLVVVDDNDDDFLVDYYKEDNKLVFFSTLTKTSWNLIKSEE